MRVILYSPDTYGLGHIRRSLSVAGALLERFPGSQARLLTGAPRAHYFDYAVDCDYVKLPSVTKDDGGKYVSLDSHLDLTETVRLRTRLIDEVVRSFVPDIFYVDHKAPGLNGELQRSLDELDARRPRPLRVLGLRDIIDEPEAVKAAWKRNSALDVMRHRYDRILVFGQREIFDPVAEYGIPPDVARKTRFVGYIQHNWRQAAPNTALKKFAPRTGRLVLATLGGGGDGNLILRAFLQGYRELGDDPPFEVVAVTGPLMSAGKRSRLEARAAEVSGFAILEYTRELPFLLEAAAFVVSMGGYNTVCEIACAGTPAVIVPRTFPRKEQELRARLFAERGFVRSVSPEQATPRRLIEEVLDGLESPSPPKGWGLPFNGLEKAASEIATALGRTGRGPSRIATSAG